MSILYKPVPSGTRICVKSVLTERIGGRGGGAIEQFGKCLTIAFAEKNYKFCNIMRKKNKESTVNSANLTWPFKFEVCKILIKSWTAKSEY